MTEAVTAWSGNVPIKVNQNRPVVGVAYVSTRGGGIQTVTEVGDRVRVVDEGGNVRSVPVKEFSKRFLPLYDRPEVVREDALRALASPQWLERMDAHAHGPESSTTALMAIEQMDEVQSIQADAMDLATRVKVWRLLIEDMMSPMKRMMSNLTNRLGYAGHILAMIESMASICDNIVMIRDGVPAPESIPLAIRQLVLYMDEETMIVNHDDGIARGLDAGDMDKFDEWIVADPRRIDILAPEQKCVVAINPARYATWEDKGSMDNLKTYLLIRNGERIYRVFTGLALGMEAEGMPSLVLFPRSGHFRSVLKQAEEEAESSRITGYEEYRFHESAVDWIRNIALIQAIIDRTRVLWPMPAGVNLFDPESLFGSIRMIRDAENLVSDGHESYQAWRKRINSTLKRGSRVLISRPPNLSEASSAERYGGNYASYLSTPYPPLPGVYTVEDVVGGVFGEKLKILYLPDRPSWSTGKPYTRRIAYYLRRSDKNVLAYDLVDAETVRYFINDRVSRSQYRHMIPVLMDILDELEAEYEYERQFVKAMAIRVGDPTRFRQTQAVIWEAVEWWKNKVIRVRPIHQDDVKAWRMIERRVIKQMSDGTWLR